MHIDKYVSLNEDIYIYKGTFERFVESIYSTEVVKTEVFLKCKTNTLNFKVLMRIF